MEDVRPAGRAAVGFEKIVSPPVDSGRNHLVDAPEWAAAWLRLGVATVAIIAVYAPIFPPLAHEWASFPTLSHGFAVPLIAGYLVWASRHSLSHLAATPTWSGLPVLVGGLALYTVGMLGGESFLARISFLMTLGGAALLLAGPGITRQLLPGIGYLFFMVPLPYLTLKGLTDQMRLVDATLAAAVLPWLGVPVFQEGFLLHLPRITLEVADECSSIPAIAALLATGAAYGFVNARPGAIRLILLSASVPLAITSNMVRIIVTAAGRYYLGPIALNNIVHTWAGTSVFVVTLGGLVLLDTGLCRFWASRR